MTKLTSYSSYWMDEELFDENEIETEDKQEASLARIARLSAARRAVSNFVNILTGRNDILVEYSSGKQSYTDGDRVVISADDNPDHFDSMVGLALHEGSHILLSDFTYLKEIENVYTSIRHGYYHYDYAWCGVDIRPALPVRDRDDIYGSMDRFDGSVTVLQSLLHPALAKMLPQVVTSANRDSIDPTAPTYAQIAHQFLDDIRMIMNVIEDRRIDKFVYQNCGGYRPYYNALYERYFLTTEVERNLKWNPEWRELTVENYINRLLFSIHPASTRTALPGLDTIIDMMDIRNIGRLQPSTEWKQSHHFDNQPELWKVANTIYAYILRFAAMGQLKQQDENPNQQPQDGALPKGVSMESVLNSTSTLPNLDIDNQTEFTPRPVENPDKMKNGKDKATTFNSKRGESAIKKAREVANGKVKKRKVSKQEKSAVDALESAQAKMVDLEGNGIPGGQCMVTRKINDKILGEDWFLFRRHWVSERDIELRRKQLSAGKRMGQILVHRLQVRNDPVHTKNTRLQHGGLDRRLLAQLGMDITSVFQKSRVDTYKPAMLHLTIDASGSMHGRKWDKVMVVATALAYVGSKMRNIDTVISIRGGNDIPIVAVVYDSRRDKFPYWMKYAPKLDPNGSTPEGLCFKATMELITECTTTHDVYFINFSDGEPGFHLQNTNYNGPRRGRRYYSSFGGDTSHCNYTGDTAINHTRLMVNMMRDHGVKVLSYFISDHYRSSSYGQNIADSYHMKQFRRMYGEDATFVNVENAGDVLRTLNKALLKRV